MKHKLCFASYEIHPTTRGGAGVLLANLLRVLLDEGHEILLVLDIAEHEFRQFADVDRLELTVPERCRPFHVDALCADLKLTEADFTSHYAWRSYRFHHACLKVVAAEAPDAIEFVDYCGVAYYALAAKVTGRAYANTHVAVRLHTSIEILDANEAVREIREDRYKLYGLERAALRMAETVLYPSATFFEKAYRPHYGHWQGTTRLATPPLLRVPPLEPPTPQADLVLYYGRLFGLKGVDRFVDAGVLYLEKAGNRRLRFALCGYDSNQPPDDSTTYTEYLQRRIPERFRDSFVFTGQIDWAELGELSRQVLLAVFPNYFESFCYAAHELYAAGLPLIVSDIPAFEDFFHHERNALHFDGTALDLCAQIERLSADESLRRQLSAPYPVASASAGDFYGADHWPSWMKVEAETKGHRSLVCILADGDQASLESTLASLRDHPAARIVVLRPTAGRTSGPERLRVLGTYFAPEEATGEPIAPESVTTEDAALFVRCGDRIDPSFLEQGLATLAHHACIGYVTSWLACEEDGQSVVDTFSLDVTPEYAALIERPYPLRVLLKSHRGRLLTEFLDGRLDDFGELGAVWEAEAAERIGVCIPAPLIQIRESKRRVIGKRALSFMFLNKAGPRLRDRLAAYFMVILNSADSPAGVSRMAQQLRELKQELDLLKSSLGWRLTVATRQIRHQVLGVLSKDPLVGRRLAEGWFKIRSQLLARRRPP